MNLTLVLRLKVPLFDIHCVLRVCGAKLFIYTDKHNLQKRIKNYNLT